MSKPKKKPLIDRVIDHTDRGKTLLATIDATTDQLRAEKERNRRLERSNSELHAMLSMKEGRQIMSLAQENLSMALTKELEQILSVMRERIAFELHTYERVDLSPGTMCLDFSVTVPAVDIRFCHRVNMRDSYEYGMAVRHLGG